MHRKYYKTRLNLLFIVVKGINVDDIIGVKVAEMIDESAKVNGIVDVKFLVKVEFATIKTQN